MSIEKVVAALNGAFAADPSAIHALVVNRVPCNQDLADDPFVQVDCPPVLRDGLFQVGAFGLLNGVLAAIGLPLAATMFSDEKDDDGRSKLIGFTVYNQSQSEVAEIKATQPEPDQYWQHKESGDRVYFIGRTPEGIMVWQCEDDNVEIGDLCWSGWEYLPGCDGWDWVNPFPKYYRNEFDSGHTFVLHMDGTYQSFQDYRQYDSGKWNPTAEQNVTNGHVVEMPREEGLRRITPPVPVPVPVAMPANEFPQYWTTIDSADQPGAYIIRKSPTTYEIIRKDGTSGGGGTWEASDDLDRTQITKAQAEALEIRKPKHVAEKKFPLYVKDCCGMIFRADSPDRIFWLPIDGGEHLQDEPALHWAEWSDRERLTEFEIGEIINRSIVAEEVKAPSDVMGQSPDDWVRQDRVPIRNGLDYGYWTLEGNEPPDFSPVYDSDWWIMDGRKDAEGLRHGDTNDDFTLHVRCRRKDLPVVNPRIPVSLYWYDGAIVGRYADSPVTDPSFVPIHSDNNGGWFIERSDNAGN